MDIFNKLFGYTKALFLKLSLKLLFYFPQFVLKCNSNTQILIKKVVILWCKISNNTFKYSAEDVHEDKIYNYAANIILDINSSNDLYEGLDDVQIKLIIDKARKSYSSEIEQGKHDFLQLQNNSNSIISNLKGILDNNSNLKSLINNSLNHCRRIKKCYKKYHNTASKTISDKRSEGHKLNLDLVEIFKLSGVFIPAFALIGGYLYIWSLFKWFSFNLAGFFTISDYITSSLNQLVNATISVFLMGLFILISRVERARTPNFILKIQEKQENIFIAPIMFIFTIYLIFRGIYYKELNHLFFVIGFLFIIVLPFFFVTLY